MFSIGFEESSANFMQGMKRSRGIAFFGALAPFALAYSIADYFWQDSNLSLMFTAFWLNVSVPTGITFW